MRPLFVLKRFSLIVSAFFVFQTAAYAQLPVAADVIVVIDESGSMAGEQSWMREAIPFLEESLQASGIGSESQLNEYGLVGFGNTSVAPRAINVGADLLGNDQEFVSAAGALVTRGGTEDGWRGVQYALDEYPRRNGAAVNIILVTDEDRDNTNNAITYQTVLASLDTNRALLNAVVNARIRCADGTDALGMDSQGNGYIVDGAGGFDTCSNPTAINGAGSTIANYVDLALENGGAVWDLNFLRSGGSNAQSFTAALLAIKVDEILSQRPIGDLVAVAQATPNPALVNQDITLDGSSSFHQIAGRSIVAWDWDLNNDGIFDASGPVISTSFPALGDYPVTLRVTDDSSTPLSAEADIVVNVNIPPLQPTADANGPYLFCPQNTPWRLDGRNSINPDDGLSEAGLPGDQITSYEWDINNDQVYGDASGALVDVTSQLNTLGVGDHIIRLRVADNTATSFPSSGLANLTDTQITQVRIRDASDALCNCINDLAARPKMTKVQLTWTDTGAASYAVYRSTTQGGPYERIATTDNRYSTYLDAGLTLDTTYYYVVEELSASGQAICRSREISATPAARRINARNRPPVVTSDAVTAAVEGVPYVYDVNATDPDRRDSITYTLEVAPTGMTIDAATGLINWTPLNAQVGEQILVIRVIDNQGDFSEQIFAITVANVNQAPVISSSPVLSATELQAYNYQVIAVDPDLGDSLTYSLGLSPIGMSIDASTGEVAWTPQVGQQGNVDVTVNVVDAAGLSDSQSFTVAVTELNLVPNITSSPIGSAEVAQAYAYQVTATDGNNDALTFSLGVFPEGMVIDPLSGLVSWTPAEAQVGNQQVNVIVTDSRGGSGSQTFSILVDEANVAPVIDTASLPAALEDQLYQQNLQASDVNGDVLTFSAINAPGNLTIDSASGEVTWLPVSNNVGTNNLTFRATDPDGLFAEQTFVVNVQNSGDAPAITSDPVQSAVTGEQYIYQVTAFDPDGDSLSYSLQTSPTGMVIDASGLIEWLPSIAQSGNQDVVVRATDAGGAYDEQSFTVLVSTVSQPVAPQITSLPVSNVIVNTVYQYQVVAQDANNDVLNYSLSSGPSGLSIDPVAGLISWVPTQLGIQTVVVRVSDASALFDTQTFTVDVTSVPVNAAPVINSTPSTLATLSTVYSYDANAVDSDGDPLVYSLTSAPVGMTIDSTTGLVTWTPVTGQDGANNVVVRVEDTTGSSAVQTFAILVADGVTNESPVISSAPELNAIVGTPYSYSVLATDVNGDNLEYLLDQAPADMSINASTGLLNWTAELTQVGDNNVSIRVLDGNGGFVTQSFVLGVTEVSAVNRSPLIETSPEASAIVGNLYQYDVDAADPDGDVLVYSLVNAPDGMSIDSASGLISWTPVFGQGPTEVVSIRVTDGSAQVEQSYLVQLSEFALPLDVRVNVTPEVAIAGETVSISVVDVGGVAARTVTLTHDGNPLVLASGQTTVIAAGSGRYVLNATVSDGVDTVSAEADYTVSDPSDITAPTAAITSPSFGEEIVATTPIIGTASDANFASYRLLVAPKDSGSFQELTVGATAVIDAPLGSIDPTLYTAGIYDLLLEVSDVNGVKTTASSVFEIVEDTPVGNFTMTFEDLSVPLGGLSIGINRIYDSREKGYNKDFGYGWSVDFQDVDIQESQNLGTNFTLTSTGGFLFPTRCIEPVGPHFVKITLPGQRPMKFDLVLQNNCSVLFPPLFVNAAFEPAAGTEGTLSANNATGLIYSGGQLLDIGSGAFNPSLYTLTTKQGYTYLLDQNFGIRTITDTNGNRLTFSANGVAHNNGEGVTFVRDGQNRITRVTDPAGSSIQYTYNVNGDLTTVTDREGNRSAYQYNRSHGLTDVVDALGRNVARNIYDDDGRLVQVVDAEGNVIEFDRNPEARQEVIRDQNNNVSVYNYDEMGNILSQTDALGNTSTFTYDENGNRTSVTNERGFSTFISFNENDYPTVETDPLGNTVTTAYSSIGAVTSITDARGNTLTNDVDSRGNVTQTTDALGFSSNNTYDASGNMIEQTDKLGHTTNMSYDSRGRVSSMTNPLGHERSFTYDVNGNQTLMRTTRTVNGVSVNVQRQKEFDLNNRVVAEVDAEGARIEYGFDAVGNQVREVDARGFVTTHEYDTRSNKVRTNYPDGSSEVFVYDGMNNKLSQMDRDGRTTRYVYDGLNQLIETIYEDGSIARMEYDSAGNIIAEVDQNGNRTQMDYDAADRKVAMTDALGNRTEYAYDNNGNMIQKVDALGRTTQYVYDALDRRTQTIYSDGTSERKVFDAMGQTLQEIDQAGQATSFEYDERGKLLSVTDALGATTRYAYDEVGNRIRQTDSEGRITLWGYDNEGRTISHTLPEGMVETFAYDLVGNQVTHTNFKGETTSFEYDSSNRLIAKRFADGNVELYEYSSTGRITKTTDGAGVSNYIYDNLDRLQRVEYATGEFIDYSFDAVGNIISITTGDGVVQYTYDVLNRLQSVIDITGGVTSYVYDSVGNRSEVNFPNGTRTAYSYSDLDRLTRIEHLASDSSLLSSYEYTLGAAGNRISVSEGSGRTVNYSYDAVYRLTEESVIDPSLGASVKRYTYDSVGNRVSISEDGIVTNNVYDNNDRLLSSGLINYTYDSNGNRLTRTDLGVTVDYIYDTQNRLISVVAPGQVAEYRYDGMGSRRASIINGIETRYLIDLNREHAQVLAELDSLGSTVVAYTYGDDLISQQRGPNISYYHYDGIGSTRLLTNEAELVTDTYIYEPFGQLIDVTGSTSNHYQFTGEQFDPNTGFYYLRSRYYDPESARFLTQDKFPGWKFDPQSLHKYNYTHNDPINKIDPSGQFISVRYVALLNRVVLGHVARVGPAFAQSRLLGGVALRSLGLAVERSVGIILSRIPGAVVQNGIRLVGTGGPRVLDFWVKVGSRVAIIEVKYGLPRKAGPALARLVGQMRTAQSAGNGAQVVLFTFRAPSQAQMNLLLRSLGPQASAIQHISGFTQLIFWASMFFRIP